MALWEQGNDKTELIKIKDQGQSLQINQQKYFD